jgi:hypothetical protein
MHDQLSAYFASLASLFVAHLANYACL